MIIPLLRTMGTAFYTLFKLATVINAAVILLNRVSFLIPYMFVWISVCRLDFFWICAGLLPTTLKSSSKINIFIVSETDECLLKMGAPFSQTSNYFLCCLWHIHHQQSVSLESVSLPAVDVSLISSFRKLLLERWCVQSGNDIILPVV